MPKTLRLGLIGCGRIGKVHAAAIQNVPAAEIGRVADISLAAAEEAGHIYRVPYSSNYHDILIDDDLDAVLICSSTDTHAQIIREAAAAGKHIFCEKPIALDLARIDAALEAVEQAGVKLMVGFQRRFDPSFRAAQREVASGRLGEPRILVITSRDPAPPPISYLQKSGGIFYDMTIHDFDLARFFVPDSPIVEVYATGGTLVDEKIAIEANDIDTTVITLKYANGATAVINNCRQSAYGYDQRLEWFGSRGQVQVQNHHPDYAVVSDGQGLHRSLPYYFFLERYMQAYTTEMWEFCACVIDDTPPPVSGIDGRWPVVIASAAMRSLRENRPVPF